MDDSKSLIELYCLHVQEYLKQVSVQLDENQIKDHYEHIYNGWSMLIHILSITYIATQDLKLCHYKLTHSRLLYLEFVDQIRDHKEHSSNPTLFVYSKILNDISLKNARHTTIPFQQMKKYAEFVLGWDNHHLQNSQRLYLANVFLQHYLIYFCYYNKTDVLPLFEYIYTKCNVETDSMHYIVLNELYTKMTSRNIQKKLQNFIRFDFLIPEFTFTNTSAYIEQLIQACIISA
jgi:hypothetical protein